MNRAQLLLLCLIPAAYLVGSVPFGLLVGLARGKDPRQHGSKNIGATNVARILGGVKWFALVFTLDAMKGLLPMLAAAWVVHRYVPEPDWLIFVLWLLAGFAAICGHMFSIFIGFKGGKGVATSAGVLLGLFPYFTYPGLVVIGLWALLFAISRMVSLASIIAVSLFPVAFVVLGLLGTYPLTLQHAPLLFFAILVPAMIVYKHRENIARLRAGTEHRFVKTTETE